LIRGQVQFPFVQDPVELHNVAVDHVNAVAKGRRCQDSLIQ